MSIATLQRLMELAATASDKPINEDISVDEQYPELVAPLMRYEMLLKLVTEDTIKSHTVSVTRSDLIKVKSIYDNTYLLSLPIPYSGIQELCSNLLNLCETYSVEPTQVWQDFADGAFDWQSDIDYLSTL